MYEKFTGRNGNMLYRKELEYVIKNGEPVAPRGKPTLEVQAVTTVLEPLERVLTVPGRAINPYFNVAENLAIIAALPNQRDWLGKFNKNYLQFFDTPNDKATHAFYGTRLRKWPAAFSADKLTLAHVDQLKEITDKLTEDPTSRQAIAALWHPWLDNQRGHRDYPCNFSVEFMIRQGRLQMTVVNRSNDIHWGLFGVNLSQWSFIQEILATILRVEVGHQTHLSNSLHLYLNEPHQTITRNMLKYINTWDIYNYTKPRKMFGPINWSELDAAVQHFFNCWDEKDVFEPDRYRPDFSFLVDSWFMLRAYIKRHKDVTVALQYLSMIMDSAQWVAAVEFIVRKHELTTEQLKETEYECNRRFGDKAGDVMTYLMSANILNEEPAVAIA